MSSTDPKQTKEVDHVGVEPKKGQDKGHKNKRATDATDLPRKIQKANTAPEMMSELYIG